MLEEERMLIAYLGLDYEQFSAEYQRNPIVRPLLDLCINSIKRVIELENRNSWTKAYKKILADTR